MWTWRRVEMIPALRANYVSRKRYSYVFNVCLLKYLKKLPEPQHDKFLKIFPNKLYYPHHKNQTDSLGCHCRGDGLSFSRLPLLWNALSAPVV